MLALELFREFAGYHVKSASSMGIYVRCLRYFASWISHYRAYPYNGNEVIKEDVIAYRDALAEKGLAPHTIRLYLTILKKYFQWLKKNELHEGDPTEGIKLPRQVNKTEKFPIELKELAALIEGINENTTEGRRDVSMILLAFNLGLRSGELSRLSLGDLSFSDNRINPMIRIRGRNAKKDSVVMLMDSMILNKLTRYFQWDRIVRIPLPELIGQINDFPHLRSLPLFAGTGPRHQGKENRLTAGAISTIISRRLRDSGLPGNYTAHSLRYGTANYLINKGMDPEDLRRYLRLKSIAETRLYMTSANELKFVKAEAGFSKI